MSEPPARDASRPADAAWAAQGRADKPRRIGGFWYSLAEQDAAARLKEYAFNYVRGSVGEKIARLVAMAMLGLCGAAASAKDICVQDDLGEYWVFKKVKGLKPGKVTPLHGIYSSGSLNAPVAGTAFMTTGGQVHVGVFVHSMEPFSGVNISVTQVADAAFTGTGKYDNDGDPAANGDIVWTSVDCALAPAP